ncbi:TIR domain protein [Gimesia chilikensis]|uniref:TIR domain protein n=1 Tax=Gimesia chilikensis TaxID=2605989 RepID=A0A517WCK3_9PLAN|nr:TIR domain-containing protein [Gimesia chilikensis]QDU02986.1 TIR domain protein [Gimesia chilikensis]
MSVNSIQSSISNVQREIQSAQRKLTDKTKEEANKTARIATVQRSITKSTSASSVQSKMREIERLQGDIVRIQNAKVDATKKIADKTQRLHSLQQDLYKAQQKEQNTALRKLQRSQEENAAKQQRQFETLLIEQPSILSVTNNDVVQSVHDVFISHASEDKDDVVRPLAELLNNKQFDVWYDEFQLRIGDSLRRSIDQGLAKSRFGIVVLSQAFFSKNWPQYELDGLVQKEMEGNKVILPIWHKITKSEVISYSPSLADKLALNTATATLEEIASQIADVLAS